MRRRVLCSMLALKWLLVASFAQAQDTKDVPDIAVREIQRRGNLVEHVTHSHGPGLSESIADALSPPADDSHKWYFSLITVRNCRYCETLKRDFATSPELKAFVDTNDHTRSWAHYNVFDYEDETQRWRFKDIRITAFPTLIVQPPRNGRFGSAKTVVMKKTGYDGNAKKLADEIRGAIVAYVAKFPRLNANRQQPAEQTDKANGDDEQQNPKGAVGQRSDPPFTPPPKVDPSPYFPSPQPYPFDIPPVPQPQPEQPEPETTDSPLARLLASVGLTNVLLGVLVALAVMQTYGKANGGQRRVSDLNVIETLRSVLRPESQPPNAPPTDSNQ